MKRLQVKTGETLFVSAAAGAVGRCSFDCTLPFPPPVMPIFVSLVGQIAKNVYQCTVIGSCRARKFASLVLVFTNSSLLHCIFSSFHRLLQNFKS